MIIPVVQDRKFFDDGVCSYTIPSKAVREYCMGKVKFTTRQKVTLLYNNPCIHHETILELYRASIDEAVKEGDLRTAEQIKQRLEAEEKYKQIFYKPEMPCCYTYRIQEKEWRNDEYGYYSSVEKAKVAAESTIQKYIDTPVNYQITLQFLDSEKSICGSFDRNGELLTLVPKYLLGDFDKYIEENGRFEDEYVQIPYPFRRGDFIQDIAYTNSRIGIFAIHKDEKEYQEYQQSIKDAVSGENPKRLDSFDMSTRVEYFDVDSKSFYHEHPYIATTDYAEVNKETEHSQILEVAAALIKGEGSIETLEYYIENMCKKG